MPTSATSEGTERYADRHGNAPGHFSAFEGLQISSIGLGTYLGGADDATDRAYEAAIERALSSGCNMVDTAANYRCQRSERTLGRVLKQLFAAGTLARDQVVVSTKGGFLPFDGSRPGDIQDYFTREFFAPGLIGPGELVAGCHCLAPGYLASQIDRSRQNLGLDTIDIYLLHNPEMQLDEVSREGFEDRLRHAFELLEERVSGGEIGLYGTATWDGYRINPRSRHHLDLSRIVTLAEEVAGANHHFRVIQLPYNLAMPEALVHMSQRVGENGEEQVTTLEAAAHHRIFVMASASIMQGGLSRELPAEVRSVIPDLGTDAQRALEFTRSTPGIGTALVGMKDVQHVDENLALFARPRMTTESFLAAFTTDP
jgi:aryl-alcohol dehydrogenase-like predicted oxidoreductase